MSEVIIEKNLGDAIAPRYKMYALETLAERAIPEIRDGLKRRAAKCCIWRKSCCWNWPASRCAGFGMKTG